MRETVSLVAIWISGQKPCQWVTPVQKTLSVGSKNIVSDYMRIKTLSVSDMRPKTRADDEVSSPIRSAVIPKLMIIIIIIILIFTILPITTIIIISMMISTEKTWWSEEPSCSPQRQRPQDIFPNVSLQGPRLEHRNINEICINLMMHVLLLLYCRLSCCNYYL